MYTVDRTNWPAGNWDNEPDRIHFKVMDLQCIMNRTTMGHWCGYVVLTGKDPLFGVDNSVIDYRADSPSVHGGITFSKMAHRCEDLFTDLPEFDLWAKYVIGFDCAHSGDLSPSVVQFPGSDYGRYEVYRDMWFAMTETISLALQCKGYGSQAALIDAQSLVAMIKTRKPLPKIEGPNL